MLPGEALVQTTTSYCAPGVVAFLSRRVALVLVVARIRLVMSLNGVASESGSRKVTVGLVEAQVRLVVVDVVGLPAASFNVSVAVKGPFPGQVIFTQALPLVPVPVTAVQAGVLPPIAAQKLFAFGLAAGTFKASIDDVRPQNSICRPAVVVSASSAIAK